MSASNSYELGQELRDYVAVDPKPSIERVKGWIASRADLDCEDYKEIDSKTALSFAAAKNYHDIVVLLIEAGAKLEAGNPIESTPLMLAAENGHYNIVKTLLEHGADANYNKCSLSVLMEACRNGHTKIAELLLEYDADPMWMNTTGQTIIDVCGNHVETAKVIAEAIVKKSEAAVKNLVNIATQLSKPTPIRKFKPK